MSITGYLVPFPDPGAWDLMSDRLEEEIQSTGPGQVLVRLALPPVPSVADNLPFARKRLLLLRREGSGWSTVYDATTSSPEALEEVRLDVPGPATLRCRLMNMGGTEAQFTLECVFIPAAT